MCFAILEVTYVNHESDTRKVRTEADLKGILTNLQAQPTVKKIVVFNRSTTYEQAVTWSQS